MLKNFKFMDEHLIIKLLLLLEILRILLGKMAADGTCHDLPGDYIEMDYCDKINSAKLKSLYHCASHVMAVR